MEKNTIDRLEGRWKRRQEELRKIKQLNTRTLEPQRINCYEKIKYYIKKIIPNYNS